MHNLISHNQLADWKHSIRQLDKSLTKVNNETDAINDYYHCLIECQGDEQACKRICKEILRT
jgi:hypothetical protein